jgi:hypothetical protein
VIDIVHPPDSREPDGEKGQKKFETTTMTKATCHHKWKMMNLRGGYLVIEGCFHCRQRISQFSQEPVPPIDAYREEAHFWSHLGDYQASKFDLKCEKCSKEVRLRDVMATMLCMRCDPKCGVYKAGSREKDRKSWVYVALCANTSHASGTCISEAGIRALNQYFNQNLHDPDKKIVVVPCNLRRSVDSCQGVVLADVGLTELY